MESKRTIPFWVIITFMVLIIGGLVYLLLGSPRTDITTTVSAPAVRLDTTKKTLDDFSDGLRNPHEIQTFQLDETGAGVASQFIYYYDINGDGISDRITRSRHENGTSHFWDAYTVELAYNGGYRDITPENLRTVRGAECALVQVQFVFQPKFQIIKISRPWQESWNTPSVATRIIYEIKNNNMVVAAQNPMKSVCDVSELFVAE